jgi:hypothetical protein
MGFADGGGVQGETRQSGQQRVVRCRLDWRYAVQGQGFAPGVGSDDAEQRRDW